MAKVRTKSTAKAAKAKGEGFDLSKLPDPVEKPRGIGALPKGWATADDVLDRVRAVPTRFVDFNRGSRVNGLPVRRIHTVHGPTHGGKAQPLDSRVLTPTGWRRFGDLAVGDLVIGADGNPTRVVGVFPQGSRPVYRATFSDGSSTECCAEHLWFTTTKAERMRGAFERGPRPKRERIPTGKVGAGSVKTFAEIMRDPARTHEIPLVEPVEFAVLDQGQPLPLDPYVLGLLLGDGSLSRTSPEFSKPEPDLHAAIRAALPEGDDAVDVDAMTIRIRGGHTLAVLREFGLHGCKSSEKYVPGVYLLASPRERLAVLRGLFDTDGYVVRGGERVEFTTTSKQLAGDVVFLVRSLGGLASVTWRVTEYTHNGERREGRPSARINAWFPNGIVPVASAKNLAKWDPKRRDRVRRSFVSFASLGEKECQCIAVESPDHLYVTDDFIVTHNTAFVGGLIESFVSQGHIGAYVDAEHATPNEFFEELFRKPLRDVPNFIADRPKSYEETIDKVDTLLRWVADEKKSAPDLASILVVDSINKLVPARELEKLRKEGADAIDKGWGRYRAAMNQAWLDHLTPMLAAADCALVVIAQERDEQSEGWGYQEEFKVKGGAALLFDASMVMRVSKGSPIKEGEGKDAKIYGFRHRVRIWKSKVAHMDGRYTDVAFHLSNGSLTPAGFDVARDLLHVGRAVGVVEAAGSWLSFSKRRWQGEQRAILGIAEDLDTQVALRTAIDAKIRKVA